MAEIYQNQLIGIKNPIYKNNDVVDIRVSRDSLHRQNEK